MFTLGPGAVLGHTSLITNNKSMFDLKASGKTYIGLLPRKTLQNLVVRFPQSLFWLAKQTSLILHPAVQLADFILDWQKIDAGQHLYREGDTR